MRPFLVPRSGGEALVGEEVLKLAPSLFPHPPSHANALRKRTETEMA